MNEKFKFSVFFHLVYIQCAPGRLVFCIINKTNLTSFIVAKYF